MCAIYTYVGITKTILFLYFYSLSNLTTSLSVRNCIASGLNLRMLVQSHVKNTQLLPIMFTENNTFQSPITNESSNNHRMIVAFLIVG